jgi:hypothetical protein
VVQYFCTEENAVFAKLTEQNTDYQRALRKLQKADDPNVTPTVDASASEVVPSPSGLQHPQVTAPELQAPTSNQPASNHLAQLLAKAAAPVPSTAAPATPASTAPAQQQGAWGRPRPSTGQVVPASKPQPSQAGKQKAAKPAASVAAPGDSKDEDRRKVHSVYRIVLSSIAYLYCIAACLSPPF